MSNVSKDQSQMKYLYISSVTGLSQCYRNHFVPVDFQKIFSEGVDVFVIKMSGLEIASIIVEDLIYSIT